MPALTTLHDLMVHQIKDLYSAERQLVQALPRMAKHANSGELQVAIQKHLEQIKTGVPGVAWVKPDAQAEWPARLAVKVTP